MYKRIINGGEEKKILTESTGRQSSFSSEPNRVDWRLCDERHTHGDRKTRAT